jgi:hypothetical protein
MCTIERPGDATASLEVRDDHGNSVRYSIVASGTNQPPQATLTGIVWESVKSFELYGTLVDPDEGSLCGGGVVGPCPYLQSATATGDCRPQLAIWCS